jgi:hypothetical protein
MEKKVHSGPAGFAEIPAAGRPVRSAGESEPTEVHEISAPPIDLIIQSSIDVLSFFITSHHMIPDPVS